MPPRRYCFQFCTRRRRFTKMVHLTRCTYARLRRARRALVRVTKMAPACIPVAGLCQWYTADSRLLEAASARLFPLVIYLYKYLKFCRQIKARPIIFYDCSCFDGLIFCRTESEYVGLRRTPTVSDGLGLRKNFEQSEKFLASPKKIILVRSESDGVRRT